MPISTFEQFVPDLPTDTRGAPYLIEDADIRQIFRAQGNAFIQPECPDTQYTVVNKSWVVHTALHAFIAFVEHIHGKPTEIIYKPNTYDCNKFVIGVYSFLSDCHRLHWSRHNSTASLAVGWGYTTSRINGPIPVDHAILLVVTKTSKGLRICGVEPVNSEGTHADYGEVDTAGLRFAHF